MQDLTNKQQKIDDVMAELDAMQRCYDQLVKLKPEQFCRVVEWLRQHAHGQRQLLQDELYGNLQDHFAQHLAPGLQPIGSGMKYEAPMDKSVVMKDLLHRVK